GSRLFRTGDRVRWLPDGRLEFLGRIDRQVKVRGHRIEPAEIEAALASHPLVCEAVVIAREEAAGGTGLVGYVVPRPESRPSGERPGGFLGALLPRYLVPALFML